MDERELQERVQPLVQLHNQPLDPNVIAAYLDDALPADERAEVEARIKADPEAMLLVRALREEQTNRPSLPFSLAAVAAAFLLALGIWWVSDDGDVRADDLATRLAAATAAHGFEPLSAEELTANGAKRGGAAWVAPIGIVTAAPEELRWRSPLGASRVEVSIEGEGLRWRHEASGERAVAPPMKPGRYVVRLRGIDTLAGQEIKRVFEVADDATRAQHADVIASIADQAPDGLAALVTAHYAVRERLFATARTYVDEIESTDEEMVAARNALRSYLDGLAR